MAEQETHSLFTKVRFFLLLPNIMNFDPLSIVGMSEDKARTVIPEGYSIRPVKINENHLIITKDWIETRINVEIMDGVITRIKSLG